MTELAWIEAALVSARPQALAALLRAFRDLGVVCNHPAILACHGASICSGNMAVTR